MDSKTDLHINIDREIKEGLKKKNLNLSEIFNDIGSEVLKRYNKEGYKYQKVREYIELKQRMERELARLESEFEEEFGEEISEHMDNGIVDEIMKKRKDEREEMIENFIEKNEEMLERRFSKYDDEVDYMHEANQVFDELLKNYNYTGKPHEFMEEAHEKLLEEE